MVYTAVHKLSGDVRAVKVIDKASGVMNDEEKLQREISMLKEIVPLRAVQLSRTTRT